jgi:hypothetical protein
MELLKPTNLKRDKLAWLPQGMLLLTAFLFSVFWLTSLGMLHQEGLRSPRISPMPCFDYMKIGKGPLAISPRGVSPEFEPLVQELVLLGKNTRPDSGALSMICLGLKTSGDRKQLVAGQKLFLAQQETYKFTEEKTDLSILPLPMTGSEVLLQIEAAPDKKEEVILTSSALFESSLDEEAYVQSLKKGKMWAPDLFLHQWGGEEYRDLSAKHKVEIDNKVYFLSVGDLLWWDGSEWKIGKSAFEDAPLAKLLSTSSQSMTMEVWDPTGYISSRINVPLQHSSKVSQKPEDVITSVRPRSPSEITCQLGKRRVIVKEGDWWIKTDRRWRSLKTADDLEAFLHHDIQGELFIFEKIENTKGKTILKGRCFDKMRAESQPLSLVVNTEKKLPVSPAKNGSSQPMIAKNKMTVPPIQHQKSDGEEKQ